MRVLWNICENHKIFPFLRLLLLLRVILRFDARNSRLLHFPHLLPIWNTYAWSNRCQIFWHFCVDCHYPGYFISSPGLDFIWPKTHAFSGELTILHNFYFLYFFFLFSYVFCYKLMSLFVFKRSPQNIMKNSK